jgi:hypothetical protein
MLLRLATPVAIAGAGVAAARARALAKAWRWDRALSAPCERGAWAQAWDDHCAAYVAAR